ncbi:hypothetical protein CDL12_28403 [Handroanthus impetiginosus]|uniref:Transposase Tnp1/En/Spm-like domain-containing protein n=1 Tax=Handroanthus impetiginosus TaxID=429701 RepID=A0A2G9G1A1_9LAMI|nr:hypothetical protein CDL12_28403 [Handroanthus impetiginosus]
MMFLEMMFMQELMARKSRDECRCLAEVSHNKMCFEEIPFRKACFRMFQTLKETLDKLEHSRNEVATPSGPSSSSYKDRSSAQFQPMTSDRFDPLMSIINRNEIVAKGYLKNMDPGTKVGGQVLGRNYYEVHINVAVKADEDLVRSYLHFNTIMDAQGVSITWPKSLVSF